MGRLFLSGHEFLEVDPVATEGRIHLLTVDLEQGHLGSIAVAGQCKRKFGTVVAADQNRLRALTLFFGGVATSQHNSLVFFK